MAGIAQDTNAMVPEQILEFPMFNFQGGNFPLFSPEGADTTLFELGLDITPLLTYAEKDQPARIFLIVDEKDQNWDSRTGSIESFQVYNHFNGTDSTAGNGLPKAIENNTRTLTSLVQTLRFNQIEVHPPPVTYARPGDYVSVKMEATGAASPYRWEVVYDYQVSFSEMEFPEADGEILYLQGRGEIDMDIDFPFPFPFFDGFYEQVFVSKDGALLFDQEQSNYPYAIDPDLILRSRQRISPYGGAIDYFMEGNRIVYETTDTSMLIVWDGMIPTDMGSQPSRIACRLFDEGTIQFLYEHPDYVFEHNQPALLGLSNGDSRLFKDIDYQGQSGFNTITLRPYQIPPDFNLEPSGWIFCRPDRNNHLYDIHVRVVDKFNRTAEGTVLISTKNLDSVGILVQNTPNPFVDETLISFDVPEESPVWLEIFNARGQLENTLIKQFLPAGPYTVRWNGSRANGSQVPTGIYIGRLIVGEQKARIKMVRVISPDPGL